MPTHPPTPFKGFDFYPKGQLLSIVVDLDSPMGVAYERVLHFEKPFHAVERICVCFPRGITRAVSEFKHTGLRLHNDRGNFIVKPAGQLQKVKSLTTVYDDFSLLPSRSLVDKIARSLRFSPTQISDFLETPRELPRSQWLDALVSEYFTRRILNHEDEAGLSFFTEEILRELLLLTTGVPLAGARKKQRQEVSQLPSSVQKVIAEIEARLFLPLGLDEIALHVGQSQSALHRAFLKHVGCAPGYYQRTRRLEEAAALLETGNQTIEEIAYLVGYENPSAFVRAFRNHYKLSPNRFRQRQNLHKK